MNTMIVIIISIWDSIARRPGGIRDGIRDQASNSTARPYGRAVSETAGEGVSGHGLLLKQFRAAEFT